MTPHQSIIYVSWGPIHKPVESEGLAASGYIFVTNISDPSPFHLTLTDFVRILFSRWAAVCGGDANSTLV